MGGTVRGFEGISTIAWNDACTAFVGNVGRMGAHAGKSFVLESIIQFSFVVTFILFLYKLHFSHDLGACTHFVLLCIHTAPSLQQEGQELSCKASSSGKSIG